MQDDLCCFREPVSCDFSHDLHFINLYNRSCRICHRLLRFIALLTGWARETRLPSEGGSCWYSHLQSTRLNSTLSDRCQGAADFSQSFAAHLGCVPESLSLVDFPNCPRVLQVNCKKCFEGKRQYCNGKQSWKQAGKCCNKNETYTNRYT